MTNNNFTIKSSLSMLVLPLSVHVLMCREDEDPEYKPLRMPFKDDLDDFTNSPLDDKDDAMEGDSEGD